MHDILAKEMSCGANSLAAGLRRQVQLARKVAKFAAVRGAPLAGAKFSNSLVSD